MITYAVEPWNHYHPECIPLWRDQYSELIDSHQGAMEMAPDIEMYKALDKGGLLVITTARDNGVLIGYCLVIIRGHPHYCKTLCGFEDSYYLVKSHRKGMNGVKLLRFTLDQLRRLGVKKVFFYNSVFIDVGKLYRFFGMEKLEEVYSMDLED